MGAPGDPHLGRQDRRVAKSLDLLVRIPMACTSGWIRSSVARSPERIASIYLASPVRISSIRFVFPCAVATPTQNTIAISFDCSV